jgi:hypothetical protein
VNSQWLNAEGVSLGEWVPISAEEWRSIVVAAGGLEALSVFSSLTDPEGVYGPRRIYTAWGHRNEEAPLVDICDDKADDGTTTTLRTLRKFVRHVS